MNGELWIWTELLAFDNTQPDMGVKEYLEHVQTIPDGISILSGIDLILYHKPLAEEVVLPPMVCSRNGHLSNGIRNRQEWTNFQIRNLVAELQKHGIKVLLSVFETRMQNFWEKEFSNEYCPEHRYAFIGKLNDGRSAGNFFIRQLNATLNDYGFDGWHAADTIVACWSILDYPTDQVIQEFARNHPELQLPDFIFEDASRTEDHSRRLQKLQYLQKNCWQVWNDAMLSAWMDFWEKAIRTLHENNKLVMVNSPNTKSIFGALQYMSMDYRLLAKWKIDYLLVESTSAAAELIWHNRRLVHEFDAVMSEMTAAMPGVKIIIMPSVKDIVETYDALEHAPCLYERDLYMQTAQHILHNGKLKRCADGLIVCLGDCIDDHQWRQLHELYDTAFHFQAVKTGELVWLHDSAMFDALREEHHQFGTWSPSQQINEIRNLRSIDISTIADVSELPYVTQPIIALDVHLWSPEKRKALLASKLPMILTGHFQDGDLPTEAETIRWTDATNGYAWCCIFLNWPSLRPGICEIQEETSYQRKPFDDSVPFSLYRAFYPHLDIPSAFWEAVANRIRELLGPQLLQNEEDGIQMMSQCAADGGELIHLISWKDYYVKPRFEITKPPVAITKESRFPKIQLGTRDCLLSVVDPIRRMPLYITPKGVLSFVIHVRQN